MRSRLWTAFALALLVSALPGRVDAQITVDVEVARDVVDRMPQDAGTQFPADVGRVYCWTRVTAAEGETIQHVWKHGDLEFPVDLEIGGSPWRTWSAKTIPAEWAGDWTVEVRDGDGDVLETVSFTVGSGAGS